MPTQREDRDTQWSLDMGDSRYVLAADATITVDEGYGIYESTNNNEIVVMGDIVATGAAVAGIRFMSSTSTLSIGAKSHIDASDIDYGIFAEGAGQQIVNRGRIEAEDTAIHGEIWGKVEQAPLPTNLINGPKLDGDPGHAAQRDIDRMFASG